MLSTIRTEYSKLLIVFIISITHCANAMAYLDPGTGSILIQGAIAAIAVGAFTMRMYWYKLKSFFTGNKASSTETEKTEKMSQKEEEQG